MKVAFVTHLPLKPEAPTGGVEAVSVNLLEWLSRSPDLELHAVTLDAGRKDTEISTWGRVQVHRLPRPKGSMLGVAVGSGRRLVSDYLKRLAPDLVHAHDTYGLMVKGLSLPRVFTVHGFIYGDTLVSGRKLPRLRAWLWRKFELAGWADQPHIISISPYVTERLRGCTRGSIHPIENPIASAFFDVERSETRGTVFCSAVISPRKNTLALIEAAARLVERGEDVRLRLAGSITNEEYGRRMEAFVREKGLGERVILLGRLNRSGIMAELATAAAYALVSLEENAPLGVEEAMAAGVPVITSNRCGMPFMVNHGESGFLVDPNDVEDIARRLEQLLTNSELRISMGRRAKSEAETRFHPDRVAQATRALYLDIVGSRSCPPARAQVV